jgi:hypothetical protein
MLLYIKDLCVAQKFVNVFSGQRQKRIDNSLKSLTEILPFDFEHFLG